MGLPSSLAASGRPVSCFCRDLGPFGLGSSSERPVSDELTVPSGSASGLDPSGLDSSGSGFPSDPHASTGFSSFDDVLCRPPPWPSERGV